LLLDFAIARIASAVQTIKTSANHKTPCIDIPFSLSVSRHVSGDVDANDALGFVGVVGEKDERCGVTWPLSPADETSGKCHDLMVPAAVRPVCIKGPS
jgi:hypothetical protein